MSRNILIFLPFFSLIYSSLSSLHDVIIIGGGASGIASFSLLSRNETDVLLLEAEDRIGGRINSVKFGDTYVDLGGEWAHINALNETIYKLANDAGFLEKNNQSRLNLLYSNRKEFPKVIEEKFVGFIEEIYRDNHVEEDISIAEYAKKKYKELTDELIKNGKIPDDFPNLLEDMLEHLRHQIQAAEGALDWNEPSAQSDGVDGIDFDYNWKGNGYKTILDVLLGKSPSSDHFDNEDKVLLNKTVIKISWNNSDDTVKIFCKDSTEYQAKKVIFTPSLGVLKSKMNEMFDPTLPDNKKLAIKTLGIGGVVKVYLEYSDDWFNKHGKINGFEFIWEKNMRLTNNTWITSLAAALSVINNPKVLCFWFDGPMVPFIEKLTDEKLTEGIQSVLNQFLGDKFDIPKPIKMLRSGWYTNENFLGAYSFQTVESRKRHSNKELGESLKNQNGQSVVFFAGEATCPVHYGTVHGAIHTGFREAENVKK